MKLDSVGTAALFVDAKVHCEISKALRACRRPLKQTIVLYQKMDGTGIRMDVVSVAVHICTYQSEGFNQGIVSFVVRAARACQGEAA